MTVSTTSRLGVTTWDAGSDPFTRAQMNDSHINLEDTAAGFNQDSSRPAAGPGFTGFFHFNNGILTYCDGADWYDLVAVGTTVVDLTASAGTVGVSPNLARSDHRHGIATDAITENMIQNNAVTRDKISNNSVDLTKLVDSASGYAVLGKTGSGSGDFAEITAGANSVLRRSGSGDLSFGTLSTAHIGNGQITTDKIGAGQVTFDKMAANSVGTDQYVDASIKAEHFAPGAVSGASVGEDSIDSINIVSGAIDTRHFADNQVTVGKIEQVVAHSILARVGTTTGNLSELVAGTDSVLRRDGSGNLAFGTIDGGHIGIDSIDSQHYAAGSIDREHLAPDIIDGTKIANDVINSEHYVAGSIDREHLAADVIDGTKIANDVINSEHYVAGSIDAEHLSNALYSSGTWQGALSGNAATATVLQTARTINGVLFNGSANITVAAAAGTLTGSTLNSAVTASSLTSVGTLGSLTVTGNIVSNNLVKCDSLQWNENSGGTGQNKFLDSGGGTLMGLWQSAGYTHLELPPGLPTLTGMSDVGINNTSKQIGIISSSKRFKHSIEPATLEQLNNIIDGLEVDFFRWNDDILENSGRPLDSEPELGMIAEKVGAAFSCATIYDENDIPLGWQKAPVVSLCVGLLKEHKDQLAAMETRLAALEA